MFKKKYYLFLIVFLHIILRKHFVPDAPHINFLDSKIFFGDNVIQFGGFIQAVKSSFLPMGYLSSSYSDDVQRLFSITWIGSILIALIWLIKAHILI